MIKNNKEIELKMMWTMWMWGIQRSWESSIVDFCYTETEGRFSINVNLSNGAVWWFNC